MATWTLKWAMVVSPVLSALLEAVVWSADSEHSWRYFGLAIRRRSVAGPKVGNTQFPLLQHGL